jgi:hypothetical protein
MRGCVRSSTIGCMFIHPTVHLEIARQRHHDLLAEASRHRLANGLQRRRRPAALQIGQLATRRETEIAFRVPMTWRGSKC